MDHELEARYQVDAGTVALTVTVGDGQRGVTLVFLDDREILAQPGQPSRYEIGAGATVANKTLSVESSVSDVRGETDRTSITYVLDGGRERKEFRQSAPAAGAGRQVDYVATFELRGGS